MEIVHTVKSVDHFTPAYEVDLGGGSKELQPFCVICLVGRLIIIWFVSIFMGECRYVYTACTKVLRVVLTRMCLLGTTTP